jgi:tetratricopeptide (TPR) repeat protein
MDAPPTIPWNDRGTDADRTVAAPSPRSIRDLEILRSLARRINANDPGAHNNLGVVYYNKGLFEEAIAHFERALELDPRMHVAERNLQIAYFHTGFFETLIAQLRERLAQNPSDNEARERLARAYAYGGDPAAAIEEWRQVIESHPDDSAVHHRLARAEQARGNLDAALVTIQRAVALDPKNARAQLLMGEILYQIGRAGEAREPLEAAIAYDQGLAEAHHLLAFVYGDLGMAQKAELASARASELNPSLSKAETNLSLDAYSTARYQELVGDRTLRPDVEATGTLAHYNLGLAFRQKALYEEALREFRLAAERGEDPQLVQQAEAEMLLLKGASQEATAIYSSLVAQEQESPKLWNELGVALHQSGQLEDAEAAYRQSLSVDQSYALAWNNLGVVRHHIGDSGDAERAFRNAIEQGRALADVYRNLGLLLWRSARKQEALECYQRSLEFDDRSPIAWTGLGVVQMELGQAGEAKAALMRAIELDPKMAEARYHLAFALSTLGDYQGALRETKLALELNPYIPQPRYRLLIDLQFEEASLLAPELDVATRIRSGGNIATFEFKAESLESAFAGALQVPAAGASRGPGVIDGKDADAWLDSARKALAQGQLELATEDAQRAGRAGADRREILLLQGEIYVRRGLAGEGVERFNAVLVDLAANGDSGSALLRRALYGAASCNLELGRMADAMEAAERLTSIAPEDVSAQRLLAQALVRVQDHARAVIVLEQARVRAPNDAGLLGDLGAAYLGARDLVRAEQALRAAIELDEFAVSARSGLGRILVMSGRHDDAAAEFRGALELIPSYGEAAFALIDLELGRGRLPAALSVLVDLLSVDPYHMEGLIRLGEVLEQARRPQEAVKAYQRVLRFDPGHSAAMRGLERVAPGSTGQPG